MHKSSSACSIGAGYGDSSVPALNRGLGHARDVHDHIWTQALRASRRWKLQQGGKEEAHMQTSPPKNHPHCHLQVCGSALAHLHTLYPRGKPGLMSLLLAHFIMAHFYASVCVRECVLDICSDRINYFLFALYS